MSFKPSDFFLSIVTFLGVLVPGAVFMFLRGQSLLLAFTPKGLDPQWRWMLVAVSAYVAGQILLAVTDPMNEVASKIAAKMPHLFPQSETPWEQDPRKTTDKTRTGVSQKEHTRPPKADDFRRALSYLRLHHAEAAGEVDRHMADYKLLRNLVAVFFIDLLWSLLASPRDNSRAIWDGGLMLLSFIGFMRMRYWARILALQYGHFLSPETPPADTKPQTTAK